MIGELAPNKKDVDDINSNSNSIHCIIPSCSKAFDFMCCDPEVEDLKIVAFLKSGELLVFIDDKVNDALNLYMSPMLGSILNAPIKKFSIGFDLVAFDEDSKFMALYDAQHSIVKIYRFDKSIWYIDCMGIQISYNA